MSTIESNESLRNAVEAMLPKTVAPDQLEEVIGTVGVLDYIYSRCASMLHELSEGGADPDCLKSTAGLLCSCYINQVATSLSADLDQIVRDFGDAYQLLLAEDDPDGWLAQFFDMHPEFAAHIESVSA